MPALCGRGLGRALKGGLIILRAIVWADVERDLCGRLKEEAPELRQEEGFYASASGFARYLHLNLRV